MTLWYVLMSQQPCGGAERSRVILSLGLTGTKDLRSHPGHGALRIAHCHPPWVNTRRS